MLDVLISNKSLPCTSTGFSERNGSTENSERSFLNSSQTLCHPKNTSISVGNDFQAPVAPIECTGSKKLRDIEYRDRDECFWNGNKVKNMAQVDEYCREALTKYSINLERALLILHCSDYNLTIALEKLKRRTVYEEQFSSEDSYIFRNAYNTYGKQFSKILQMLPYKSIYALVEHYYKNKKKQQYKITCDLDSNKDYDSDDESQSVGENAQTEPICENCRNEVNRVYFVDGLKICRTCQLYFRATNRHRLCNKNGPFKNDRKPKCPADMCLIVNEFCDMAQTLKQDDEQDEFEDMDESGDLQIEAPKLTKSQLLVQEASNSVKEIAAKASQLEHSVRGEHKRILAESDAILNQARSFLSATEPFSGQKVRTSNQWTKREEIAAFHALVRFNGDIDATSDIICSKSPEMVKNFFVHYENEIRQRIEECKAKEMSYNDSSKSTKSDDK